MAISSERWSRKASIDVETTNVLGGERNERVPKGTDRTSGGGIGQCAISDGTSVTSRCPASSVPQRRRNGFNVHLLRMGRQAPERITSAGCLLGPLSMRRKVKLAEFRCASARRAAFTPLDLARHCSQTPHSLVVFNFDTPHLLECQSTFVAKGKDDSRCETTNCDESCPRRILGGELPPRDWTLQDGSRPTVSCATDRSTTLVIAPRCCRISPAVHSLMTSCSSLDRAGWARRSCSSTPLPHCVRATIWTLGKSSFFAVMG